MQNICGDLDFKRHRKENNMTQEDKELLLKDLLGRVLYGVKVDYHTNIFTLGYNLYLNNGDVAFENNPMLYFLENIESVKPYLRPMSSMTEEERGEFRNFGGVMSYSPQHDTWAISALAPEAYDWLNKNMFDYRGLIEKGLALKAPKDMYNMTKKMLY